MKIRIKKQQEQEVEVPIPSFFKDDYEVIGIVSENRVIRLTVISNSYISVVSSEISNKLVEDALSDRFVHATKEDFENMLSASMKHINEIKF